jgi:bifunctional non-homologous end joining protein LigD
MLARRRHGRIHHDIAERRMLVEHGGSRGEILVHLDEVHPFFARHVEKRLRIPIGRGAVRHRPPSREWAPWLRTVPIYHEGNKGPTNYVLADGRASLLYLTNLGSIDQNPSMSRVGSLDNPDFVLIDLDPQECPFDMIVEAALLVKKRLDALGLAGYPKTTGGDGMHIYIPLEPVYSFEDSRNFAELLARLVFDEQPGLFTTPRAVARRQKGRVYFDYLQNAKIKTIAAPYALRAHPGATVSTPLAWREVKKGLSPSNFTIKNAPARFARVGDLFRGVLEKPQRLEPALERLAAARG